MAPESKDVSVRLQDIQKAIAGIQDTVGGLGFEHYTTVWWIKHACERGIEIISEASRHIPGDLKDAEPNVPWKQIAGVGNILRHDYQTVSDIVLWDIIVDHLNPLGEAVRRLEDKVAAQAKLTES
jgi:uncharacterized protein with HEPN domain